VSVLEKELEGSQAVSHLKHHRMVEGGTLIAEEEAHMLFERVDRTEAVAVVGIVDKLDCTEFGVASCYCILVGRFVHTEDETLDNP
jgi:hypothetical protein